MRLSIRILVIATVSLVLLFSAFYFILVFHGSGILSRSLEGITHKKVSIGSFGVTPPLNMHIRNLNIEGLAKADSVFLSPSITGFFLGRITINELMVVKPEINYENLSPGKTESATSAPAVSSLGTAPANVMPPEPLFRGIPLPLVLKRLIIKDGKVNFTDNNIGTSGISLTIKDINFDLTDLYLINCSTVSRFSLKARIPWKEGQDEGTLDLEGWMDLCKKDMQATLNINGIDGVYLYPFYSKWVDMERARIEKARLNFRSNIHGVNNDVTADCHLELVDIVFRQRTSEEPKEKAERIATAVLDIFRTLNQGKIVLDFTIHTKMDRPEFGVGNIKSAVESKLTQGRKPGNLVTNILLLPTNLLQGTVRGATDLSKAVVEGTFSVGKELKKSVEDTFKK